MGLGSLLFRLPRGRGRALLWFGGAGVLVKSELLHAGGEVLRQLGGNIQGAAEPEKGPPPPSREAKKQAAKAHAKTYRKARRGERRTRTLGAPRSKPKGGKR